MAKAVAVIPAASQTIVVFKPLPRLATPLTIPDGTVWKILPTTGEVQLPLTFKAGAVVGTLEGMVGQNGHLTFGMIVGPGTSKNVPVVKLDNVVITLGDVWVTNFGDGKSLKNDRNFSFIVKAGDTVTLVFPVDSKWDTNVVLFWKLE